MPPSQCVTLKFGKDKAIRNHHHWIFSGAIQTIPPFQSGDFLPVYAANGDCLGTGYFNRRSGIIGRMVAFDSTPPLIALEERLEAALQFRQQWFDSAKTTGYRLINGEGDGIPGLILDVYDRVIVLQSATKGIDCLKPWLINWLNCRLQPCTIYEKSLSPSRKEEGLTDQEGFLSGNEVREILFQENGLTFMIDLLKSQKTGFFLDHREMRLWVRHLARDKNVLNVFSYTGGFSISALAGGAREVVSVDISQDAIDGAKANTLLNGLDLNRHRLVCQDAFTFLRDEPLPYDLVLLDPPAFAKKQKDVIAACRGYKDINRLAMQKMPSHSLLLTSSCSYHVDEELFQKVLFQAALEAKKQVRIIGRHRLAVDHPINLYHPESYYLKSFLLLIE